LLAFASFRYGFFLADCQILFVLGVCVCGGWVVFFLFAYAASFGCWLGKQLNPWLRGMGSRPTKSMGLVAARAAGGARRWHTLQPHPPAARRRLPSLTDAGPPRLLPPPSRSTSSPQSKAQSYYLLVWSEWGLCGDTGGEDFFASRSQDRASPSCGRLDPAMRAAAGGATPRRAGGIRVRAPLVSCASLLSHHLSWPRPARTRDAGCYY
jgi:hypothetical protein